MYNKLIKFINENFELFKRKPPADKEIKGQDSDDGDRDSEKKANSSKKAKK